MVRTITLNEPYLACQNRLGEGCLWDVESQLLYWLDIKNGQIWALDPKTGNYSIDQYDGEWITSLALTKDGKHFIGTHNTRLAYFPLPARPTSKSPEIQHRKSVEPPQDKRFEVDQKYFADKEKGCDRFNDGSCDAQGRFWVGTMELKPGTFTGGQFYRYDPDGSVETFREDVGVSNGLGWTLDRKSMYYIDSAARKVVSYDFDESSGKISSPRTFAADGAPFSSGSVPDGMCTDAEGGVWVARWSDSKVVRYLPDGTMDIIIEIPGALNITCCIFGGEDLGDLYITSATATEIGKDHAQWPQGGDLFRVRIDGIKGVERHRFGASLEL